jgi:hypothetical protein
VTLPIAVRTRVVPIPGSLRSLARFSYNSVTIIELHSASVPGTICKDRGFGMPMVWLNCEFG